MNFFINNVDWTVPTPKTQQERIDEANERVEYKRIEKLADNAAILRHLLNLWIELDERRHPEFQAKELLEQSKELIKNSRI